VSGVPDLEAALRATRDGGGRAFVPYVTGGLPGVDADLLRGLEEIGADAVEVGIPFSDPVMDGGVIQEASRLALEGGTRPADVLATVKEAGLSVPVAVMTYINPILRHGPADFLEVAVQAGVSGVIVPDLPVDEAEEWMASCAKASVAPVFLAAPGSSRERLALIASAARGFVYCVATYGVTGERERLGGTAEEVVGALRPLTDLPLLVGVGIGTPGQAAEACAFADGVIVGSALVRRLVEGDPEGALGMAREFRAAIEPVQARLRPEELRHP
jgi:tryptophan synthase alpha chain